MSHNLHIEDMTAEEVEQLIAQRRKALAERAATLYREHGTLRAIAPLLGCSQETARQLLHEAGVQATGKRGRLTGKPNKRKGVKP